MGIAMLLLVAMGAVAGVREAARDPSTDGLAEGDWVRFELTATTAAGEIVHTTEMALAQEEAAAGNRFFQGELNASRYVPYAGHIVLPQEEADAPVALPRYLLGATPGSVVTVGPLEHVFGVPNTFTFDQTLDPLQATFQVDLDKLEAPTKWNATLATYGDTTLFKPGHRFLLAGTLDATVTRLEDRTATITVDAADGDTLYSRPLGFNLSVERLADGRLLLHTLLKEGDEFRAYDCKPLPVALEPGDWRVTKAANGSVTVEPAFSPEARTKYMEPLHFAFKILEVRKASWDTRLKAVAGFL